MTGGGADVAIRVCRPADFPQLRNLTCARPGDKSGLAAQAVIRESPDLLTRPGSWAEGEVVVADDHGTVVGAVVYGLEAWPVDYVTIFSLGVVVARQRQGIGTALKMAVMGEVAERDGWPKTIASEVHRTNYRMIGLNDKLGVTRTRDPTDGEYLICGIAVEAP